MLYHALYLPYFYHSFRSYQNNWFIISILFYRYSPGNSGGELSSSPASSITSGSTRSHNHKDSKNLKQSNLPSTHPVSHGSWNPFSKKGSDKSNSKTSQHVTPHHINDNIILRWLFEKNQNYSCLVIFFSDWGCQKS